MEKGSLVFRAQEDPAGETTERISHSNRLVVFGSNVSCGEYISGLRKDLDELGLTEVIIKQERDINYLQEGFYGSYQTNDDTNPTRSLPVGVILLPEMRQYHEMTGMSVPTFESSVPNIVRDMCRERSIPLVEIYRGFTQEQVKSALQKLRPQA